MIVIDELLPGQMMARKRGIQEAANSIVLFCDDDNHLSSDYITEALKVFKKFPEVGIVGGWCKPKLSFYPGKWIESNYGALAIEANPRSEGYTNWVFGAGMLIRKKIFMEMKSKGIELLLTGRLGTKHTSGDDAEICQISRFLGHKVYYTPNLILFHKIAPHRLSRWSFIKANFRNGHIVKYFYIMEALIKDADVQNDKLYFSFTKSRIFDIFYFIPRIIFGKSNFFSFMIFYQNIQLLYEIVLGKTEFANTYDQIKRNLYGRERGEVK